MNIILELNNIITHQYFFYVPIKLTVVILALIICTKIFINISSGILISGLELETWATFSNVGMNASSICSIAFGTLGKLNRKLFKCEYKLGKFPVKF